MVLIGNGFRFAAFSTLGLVQHGWTDKPDLNSGAVLELPIPSSVEELQYLDEGEEPCPEARDPNKQFDK